MLALTALMRRFGGILGALACVAFKFVRACGGGAHCTCGDAAATRAERAPLAPLGYCVLRLVAFWRTPSVCVSLTWAGSHSMHACARRGRCAPTCDSRNCRPRCVSPGVGVARMSREGHRLRLPPRQIVAGRALVLVASGLRLRAMPLSDVCVCGHRQTKARAHRAFFQQKASTLRIQGHACLCMSRSFRRHGSTVSVLAGEMALVEPRQRPPGPQPHNLASCVSPTASWRGVRQCVSVSSARGYKGSA